MKMIPVRTSGVTLTCLALLFSAQSASADGARNEVDQPVTVKIDDVLVHRNYRSLPTHVHGPLRPLRLISTGLASLSGTKPIVKAFYGKDSEKDSNAEMPKGGLRSVVTETKSHSSAHHLRVTVSAAGSSEDIPVLNVVVQYFAKPFEEKKASPRQVQAHAVKLTDVGRQTIAIDFPSCRTSTTSSATKTTVRFGKVRGTRPRPSVTEETRNEGDVYAGVIVSVLDDQRNLLYQAASVASLAKLATVPSKPEPVPAVQD